jgi:hypothetical protein
MCVPSATAVQRASALLRGKLIKWPGADCLFRPTEHLFPALLRLQGRGRVTHDIDSPISSRERAI